MQLANVILFLTMALVFTILGYVNRARLSANFGIEGLDVIINVAILLTIMLAVGFTGVVNLRKKVKADPVLGKSPDVGANPDKTTTNGSGFMQLLRQNIHKKKRSDKPPQA